LIRFTPQAGRSSAKRESCDPLVVSVCSSSAPLARWRESDRMSIIASRRISGSPPVSRILRAPSLTQAEHSRSSSSNDSTSRFGRKLMCSGMQ